MAVVIKEIHVRTVVEKKLITETELSEEVCRKIERQVLAKLAAQPTSGQTELRRRRER